ncbi:ABC transporter ATP-binding protein [Streptomyces sp. WAC05374]|uniref:ABC transporter ATP-binding protein n=1 Tax=Streptomyces sp. WAC05374 TaxID=2487420 RepID=UPI000F88EE9B|nr:ABC transporter ATP-binding protein [Streptomyces sp. WAC05374]RST12726.1 ABC transporter ATP-binding protein [Streptomyces sp. WAC05374]TDF50540.1 ABC transporter ATP-binding protein [Streptomyces sp. WAC05374]TDF56829.1 ABC transporter ATP-binding protein [Streptomyces sp. WAC05374]TDF60792.1 ABC transporter ATP-binding protein [Streptomyces sp. WAC05374]
MSASELTVEGVTLSAGARLLVRDVSLTARPGEVVGLVGPNGSGKSSLLRAVYRVLRPDSGCVRVDGTDVRSLPVRRLARTLAAVVQDPGAGFDLTVREVVAMGRSPHKRLLDGDTAQDARLIASALASVDATGLADRLFDRLSGGERQRVLIARALAQQPALLVLDEPTNHLDVRHQLEVLGVLRRLPATVLVALHDLNLAAYYCDRLHVLRDGEVHASGPPAEVLTARLLAEVYGVAGEVAVHPRTGAPQVTFLPGDRDGTAVDRSAP